MGGLGSVRAARRVGSVSQMRRPAPTAREPGSSLPRSCVLYWREISIMPRLWLAMGVGVACLVASGVLVTLARAQATGDPAAVIAAYETARNQRDLDLALSYFADDATLTQRNTTFSGKVDIRKYLEGFSTRARFNTVSDRQVNGSRVT